MSWTCGESAGSEQETYWSLQDDSEVELGQVHALDAKTASSGVQSGRCGSPQCSNSSGEVQDAKESKNEAGERSQGSPERPVRVQVHGQPRHAPQSEQHECESGKPESAGDTSRQAGQTAREHRARAMREQSRPRRNPNLGRGAGQVRHWAPSSPHSTTSTSRSSSPAPSTTSTAIAAER